MPLKLHQRHEHHVIEYIVYSEACPWRSCWTGASVAVLGVVLVGAVAAANVVVQVSSAAVAVLLLSAAALVAAVAAAALLRVSSESLVVLQGVGVLLVTQRGWRWCTGASSSGSSDGRGSCSSQTTTTRQFLDIADIHSVFIHETLTTTNIHTHLAFMLHNSNQLAVAFPNLSPKLDVLVPLYRELQQQLFCADEN